MQVVATEQTLCSRSFGLKGKVDATVFVEYEPPTEIGKEVEDILPLLTSLV